MVFVFWSVVLLLSLLGLFFINYGSIRVDTGSLVLHDQLLARSLLVEQAKQLAITFGITMFVFIVLMGFYVMAYAHRMTGPIHKMNMVLQKATQERTWPKHLSFRKADAFHELAKNFNEFVETMKSKN